MANSTEEISEEEYQERMLESMERFRENGDDIIDRLSKLSEMLERMETMETRIERLFRIVKNLDDNKENRVYYRMP